jgi:hypothetical protein
VLGDSSGRQRKGDRQWSFVDICPQICFLLIFLLLNVLVKFKELRWIDMLKIAKRNERLLSWQNM